MFCQLKQQTRLLLGRLTLASLSSITEKTGKRGLDAALSEIEKQFGKNTIMKLGSNKAQSVPVIPSGSLGLDFSLGIGGLPRGRIVEIYGPESSGKTTLALHSVASCQKLGGTCVYIDAEHALDPSHAKSIGVDLDSLYVSQPDNGEQALEIVDNLIKSGDVGVVVIDSVAALTPKAELDGEMGDHHIALQARLMSQALRKITASVAKTQTIVIFINQLRQKVGVVFGSNEVTTGGMALRYYASVRVEVRKIGQIKRDGIVVGTQIRAKVSKNKLAPPFRQSEFDIVFGEGIDNIAEVIDLGVKFGLIRKTGAWFSCLRDDLLSAAVEKSSAVVHDLMVDDEDGDDEVKSSNSDRKYTAMESAPLLTTDESGWIRIGQGRDKSRIFLKENKLILASLEASLRKIMQMQISREESTSARLEPEIKPVTMPVSPPPSSGAVKPKKKKF